MIFNSCLKFQEDIYNGFHVKHRNYLSQNCFLQVQRGIIKNIHIQELWLLCSSHRLMMLSVILVRNFMNIILNGFYGEVGIP